MWPQSPFLDGDVVRACMSVPAHERVIGDEVKPLLRASLRGLVPGTVFDRRTKGDYLGEEYLGVRANAAELRARLVTSPLADHGLIEPRAVLRSVDRIVMGADGPFPALNRLVAFDLWLRSIS
ncbi:asparagine synthase-related protein [Actinokineospora sp. 24-640]